MGWTVYNSDGKILQSAELSDNAVTTAKILDANVTLAKMASQSVDEDNLYISNAGSNGDFLSKSSNAGGLTWDTAGGPTAATQANIEDGITGTYYAPLDLIKHSPGVAKFWCKWIGTTIDAHYNVGSVTHNGPGAWTINLGTNFDSGDWVAFAMIMYIGTSSTHATITTVGNLNSTTLKIEVIDYEDGTFTNPGKVFAGGFGQTV